MSDEKYWKVDRGMQYCVITCPHCDEWFEMPNTPGNAESYRFCPGCGRPVAMKQDDMLIRSAHRGKFSCRHNCGYLAQRQEEYDDEPMGYCTACNDRFIGSMDDIRAEQCMCVKKG